MFVCLATASSSGDGMDGFPMTGGIRTGVIEPVSPVSGNSSAEEAGNGAVSDIEPDFPDLPETGDVAMPGLPGNAETGANAGDGAVAGVVGATNGFSSRAVAMAMSMDDTNANGNIGESADNANEKGSETGRKEADSKKEEQNEVNQAWLAMVAGDDDNDDAE